jgi:iron complex outermembrane receptor protein
MKKILGAATAVWMFVPALAMAQAGQPADSDDDQVILVTAERRAEDVQDVPISIVALSGETLRERGVDNLDDLTQQVPSLSFVDNGNTKYVNIRGIGITESAPNQTVGIAIHLDGAYLAREFNFNDAFFDLENVQVLRGPQGTYSGQNASGGAIFIETARPQLGGIEGYINATAGSYSRRDLEAALSVPVSQTLAVRFSGRYEQRDSYFNNLAGDVEPGNRENYVGRAQVLWEPGPDFQARLIHQRSHVGSDGSPRVTDTPANRANPFVLNYTPSPYAENETEYHRTTGRIRWDPSAAFRVNGTLAYQRTSRHFNGGDTDYTPANVSQGFNDLSDEYWVGELNLVSMSDGPLEWTVGATFLDYTQDGNTYSERGAQLTTRLGRNFDIQSIRENQAVFAELGYRLTDTLQVKVGGRYNRDKTGFTKFLNYANGGVNLVGTSVPLPANGVVRSFEQTTGRVLINWQPNADHLIYATISRGYKPGGLTGTAQFYESEVVTNWEAGWKGTLADGLLETSVSAFWMDYDGFQGTVQPDPTDPTSRRTNNIDNTRIKGVEAQLAANIGGFRADVGLSYVDSSYGPFNDTIPTGAFGNTAPVAVSIGGRQLTYAPEFSLNAGVSYEIPIGDGALTPSMRVSHTSQQFVSFFQLPYQRIDARTLLDARLTYEPNDTWRFAAFITNLLDQTYLANASQTNNGIGDYILGAPQEIGVTVTLNF